MSIDVVLDDQDVETFKKVVHAYTKRAFVTTAGSSIMLDAARYFYAVYRAYPSLAHQLDEETLELLEEVLERHDWPANRRHDGKRMFTVHNVADFLERFAGALDLYAEIERHHEVRSDAHFFDLLIVEFNEVRITRRKVKTAEQWLQEWNKSPSPVRDYVNIWTGAAVA